MDPELTDTWNWLRALDEVVGSLEEYERKVEDPAAAECVRKALACVEYLTGAARELPTLHETMLMLTRRDNKPEAAAVDALHKFQEALVDVGRAVIHARHLTGDAFADTPLPPYDQWLPFKDGVGVH